MSVLPEGWQEYFDETNQCAYYYNESTHTTQWEVPTSSFNYAPGYNQDTDNYSDMDDGSDENDLLENHTREEDVLQSFDVSLPNRVNISSFKTLSISGGLPESRKNVIPIGGNTINYLNAAKSYKEQRQYASQDKEIKCSLCKTQFCEVVFFPCEHRCVCNSCLQSSHFCEDRHMNDTVGGYCICPICAGIIKRILPYENGLEIEKYWKWVLEVNPQLPQGFLKNFRHSAAVIQKVYVEDDFKRKINGSEGQGSAACSIS